jgi:hypothetical protein
MRDLNRDWALRLAETGIAVFPCRDNKKPFVEWRSSSSSDPNTIIDFWNRFPWALPAIDLEKSDLVVLDGDRHGGPDGRSALRELLRQQDGFNYRAAPTVITPNDGIHVYFGQNGHRLGNGEGDLPDGINVRGFGGYVICPYAILPDGRRYRGVDGTSDLVIAFRNGTIPHVPQHVVDLIRAFKPRANNWNQENIKQAGIRERAFAEKALQGCAAELTTAAQGERNTKLNATAYRMGRMVARGWLSRSEVEAALLVAMYTNGYVEDDGIKAAAATLHSGLDSGMAEPHPDLSDRNWREHSDSPRQREDLSGTRIEVLRASEVEQKPVDWLWPGRLAIGKQTLVGGDPGLGKSHIGIDIGARITTGTVWPDGEAPKIGNYLILSAEDAANDTICPRLEAAGADLSRVHIVQAVVEQNGSRRSFNLQRDLEALGNLITRVGNVMGIMVDPITAYMGDTDSHRTTDVRATLEPFDKFADAYRVAIFAITHPPKASTGKAIHSFTGSLAFVAAARVAFIAIEEEGQTGRSLFLPVKNNLGSLPDGIGYRIEPATTSRGISISHLVWDDAPVFVTANEAIASATASRRERASDVAEQFLRDYLYARPMLVDDVMKAARENGISETTLKRAKTKLGIIAEKKGYQGPWVWKLP